MRESHVCGIGRMRIGVYWRVRYWLYVRCLYWCCCRFMGFWGFLFVCRFCVRGVCMTKPLPGLVAGLCFKGCAQESVGCDFPGRYGAVGVLEQTERCFGMGVSGFVYGAVEQDEVTPVAADVEVFYGDKGYGLGSESVWERGLCHIVLLRICGVCVGFQG